MKAGANLLASTAWSAMNALAAGLSRVGLPPRRKLPCRVISVGNLQAGGSGKTPLVIRIAREALERGMIPAILSRGYSSRWERAGGLILPHAPAPSVSDCGDEVALIHERVPGAAIAIGADRARHFDRLVSTWGRAPDLVLLDDGFQNRSLKKDLEILALTSAGRAERVFREFPGALRRADLVVWTKGDRAPDAFGRPLCRVVYRVPPPARKEPCYLVTGVGDPRDVRETLAGSGYEIREHLQLPDHASPDRESAERLAASARGRGLVLLMTGKDWVKWKGFLPEGASQVVEPELEFAEGRETWERILWGS